MERSFRRTKLFFQDNPRTKRLLNFKITERMKKRFWILMVLITVFAFYYKNYFYYLLIISISNDFEWFICKTLNSRDWLKADFTKITQNISETKLEFCQKDVFDEFNLNKSHLFGLPFISNVWINNSLGYNTTYRSLAKWIFATNFNNIDPSKIQCGDIVFSKIELIDEFFQNYHPQIKNSYILITHEHDFPAGKPEHLKYLNDPKIIRWFAQNIIAKHPKLIPIPIGIMPPPAQMQNFTPIYEAMKNIQPYYNRTTLLFLTFSQQTNKSRIGTFNYFKSIYNDNIRFKINENRLSWDTYLSEIRNSQFVLSPPGNGIDCFRTWESLYLGAVPIVLNTTITPLYEDLPVMIVNNWSEVTEENMLKFQRENLKNLTKEGIPWRPKAFFRYWINQIMEYKTKVENEICQIK